MAAKPPVDLYDGKPPGLMAVYSVKQAAHNLRLPTATVRSWVIGRKRSAEVGQQRHGSLIAMANPDHHLLSFNNLVEIHVLSVIRRIHGISMPRVRKAIKELGKRFDTVKPLLDTRFLTDDRSLFIEEFGEVVNLSDGGQMEMKKLLEAYLRRVQRDPSGTPVSLYPFTSDQMEKSPLSVIIDPKIQFGKPCIAGTGIPTSIIAERHDAGDSVQELAADYERSPQEIQAAIRYECAGAA